MSAEPSGVEVGAYRVSRTLGMGEFAKVKVAEHLATGLTVAIKMVNRRRVEREGMEEKLWREMWILRQCRHPHVVRLYESIWTPSDAFLVLEFGARGDLFDYVVSKGRLDEGEARVFFAQIAAGLAYIHHSAIVHRDVKPENLLLDGGGSLKIADFGLANVLRDGDLLRTSCGSPNYAAPEVIAGRLYAGPEVDVWSAGCVLYALLCGRLPFEDESVRTLFRRIRAGMYSLPNHLSPDARDLVSRILVVDPVARLTVAEIRRHAWFDRVPASLRRSPEAMAADVHDVDQDALDAVCHLIDRGSIRDELGGGSARESRREKLRDVVAGSDRPRRRWCHDVRVAYHLVSDYARMRHRLASPPDPPQPRPEPLDVDPPLDDDRRRPAYGVQRKRWYLGIQSRKDPAAVMHEIYTTLLHLGCHWKPRSADDLYRVQARSKPAADAAKPVTIVLNLFKVRAGVFLLDFQNVDGNWFTFISFAADIIRTLQAISSARRDALRTDHDSRRASSSSYPDDAATVVVP
mmetsp:Transcript_6293/g.19085  ORF Transcript_6293/g.19085 Transcript_6293/m.19085 type:complete len:519 (-) Transcript_6293:153-1709(-)